MKAMLPDLATFEGQPWLLPYLPVARAVLGGAGSVASALEAAREEFDCPVNFVEHTALPVGEPYEAFIARTGCVPTRDDPHDLFNGLVWLSFPQTKRRLNALQAGHISRHGVRGARGPVRDALTVFDENAAFLQAPQPIVDALRHRDWSMLFLKQRALWRTARFVLFGHALMEKLLQPRKAITAHVWLVDSVHDASVAASIDAGPMTTRMFLPMPVLGVPGWWRDNEEPNFYDDPEVFRAPR